MEEKDRDKERQETAAAPEMVVEPEPAAPPAQTAESAQPAAEEPRRGADPEGPISLVGLNHKTAPLAARERWSFPPEQAAALLEAMRDRWIVVLSTCNRTEVYGLGDASALLEAVAAASGRSLEPDRGFFYTFDERGAVRHLFRVAAGLDSQIVGEAQIQGQIRAALDMAQRAGPVAPELRALFEHALQTGKRARAETKIGEGTIDAGRAGIILASKVYHDPAQHPVLLIGSGKVGRLAARVFRDAGAKEFRVTSRTSERAEALAAEFQAEARPFEALDAAIAEADIVISSTAAPEPIVDHARLKRICHVRGQRPLVIIDLAIPRDFAPDVARIPSVFLSNVDDLTAIVMENVRGREGEIPKVERITEEEAEKFASLRRYRSEIEPLLRALHRESEGIQRAALDPLRGRLDPDAFGRVEEAMRAVSRRLLFLQTERLKTLRDGGGLGPDEARILRRLFLPEGDRDDPSRDAR
ncbi:MAG: glutamyl-tRNA reductase [Planctomycetes bacterium]|nr:glutamyl-tRNA reductase [Planctomycetota bacterium]